MGQLRVAVVQSNYIPWKGYFDLIHDVDLFVFYDDVQYTKNDWRNRNRIKMSGESRWLTVPVGAHIDRRICDVEICDSRWQEKHWKSIKQAYGRAPFFASYAEAFRDFYLGRHWRSLSTMNQHLVTTIARDFLGIGTKFVDSRQFEAKGVRLERLVRLLVVAGATEYVSGPSARSYIDSAAFDEAGIKLTFKTYAGYPEYPQFAPPFDHYVSVVDLLFQVGPNAPYFIWGWRAEGSEARPRVTGTGVLKHSDDHSDSRP